MKVDINKHLAGSAKQNGISIDPAFLPGCVIETDNIKAIMINECPPADPEDYFYNKTGLPEDLRSVLSLFSRAGISVSSMEDILNLGIYITTAIKSPKTAPAVSPDVVRLHLPILEEEINLFPNLKAITLMGDTARKAFNMISKKNTGKNALPSTPTYKIRGEEFYYKNIRVFPSYIMTGGNLLIEKGKCGVISDDIRKMFEYILL